MPDIPNANKNEPSYADSQTESGKWPEALKAFLGKVVEIPLACIHPNPDNPGPEITQEMVTDLAANISPLLSVLAAIRETTDVPMVGAGGVMTGRDAAAVLGAGAIAVQLGTALLCTPEAGTSGLHRQALLDARYPDTILTRAYSGRFARWLANRFALEHVGQAPRAYPEVHHLTRPLRAAAIQVGDASVPNLWAGTGWRQLTAEPAATIVRRIAADARSADF